MDEKLVKYKEMMNQFRLFFAVSRRFYGETEKNTKLTPQQGRALMFIQGHPGLIQREIADNFRLRNASVTNMLKILERDGYIERRQDEKSARIKRIFITDLGEKQVIEIRKSFDATLKKVSEKIDEDLMDQLIPLLKKLNYEIEK